MPSGTKILILALGNPILSDDAVGWIVADRLVAELPDAGISLLKESGATFDLLGKIAGFDRLVVIDAIQLGTVPVGSVHCFSLDDLRSTIRLTSAHDLNFATAFALGREMGYDIPEDICIYGIEVKELRRFSEELTPEVESSLEEIVETIKLDMFRDPVE